MNGCACLWTGPDWSWTGSAGERGCLREQDVGAGQGGVRAERGEDISRRAQRLSGLGRPAEAEQAPALSQECLRPLPRHLESLPPPGGVGKQGNRLSVPAVLLGQQGAGGHGRVLIELIHRLEAVREPPPEIRVTRRDRNPYQVGETPQVVQRV